MHISALKHKKHYYTLLTALVLLMCLCGLFKNAAQPQFKPFSVISSPQTSDTFNNTASPAVGICTLGEQLLSFASGLEKEPSFIFLCIIFLNLLLFNKAADSFYSPEIPLYKPRQKIHLMKCLFLE